MSAMTARLTPAATQPLRRLGSVATWPGFRRASRMEAATIPAMETIRNRAIADKARPMPRCILSVCTGTASTGTEATCAPAAPAMSNFTCQVPVAIIQTEPV